MRALGILLVLLATNTLFSTPARSQSDPFQSSLPPGQIVRANQAKVMLRAGNLAEGITLLETLLKENPSYYRAQYNLGLALLAKGEHAQAAAALERAREIRDQENLSDTTIFNSLGWAYYLSGNLERAEKWYLEGVQNASTNGKESNQRVFNNLGVLYMKSGRFEEAEKALVQARDDFGSTYAVANLELIERLKNSDAFKKDSGTELAPKP